MKLSGQHAMTLDEALRIEANAESGILDTALPGTQSLVDEAHRVHVNALLWGGTSRQTAPRRVRMGIAMGVGMVIVTLGGFCMTFFASH